jgi:hypothetical protein
MSRVVVFERLTLEGAMQAPGGPDEDRRGGFEHGGRARLRRKKAARFLARATWAFRPRKGREHHRGWSSPSRKLMSLTSP